MKKMEAKFMPNASVYVEQKVNETSVSTFNGMENRWIRLGLKIN